MWLLDWAEATAIAPTSLSAKHKKPIWLPASSGLQETPSQHLLPGEGWGHPYRGSSARSGLPLSHSPRVTLHSFSTHLQAKNPPRPPPMGPMGLCCRWCCSLDRGQPSSHMTHTNKSGRGGVVGKFINPYQTAPKL